MNRYHAVLRLTFMLFIMGWALASTVPAAAADLVVTRYFSGLWDQPKQESQGIILQVIDQYDDHKKVVAYWFTYGDDQHTAWYMGLGEVVDDRIELTLYTAYGVGFMEDDLPGNASVFEAGAMTLAFHNCNHGLASYELSGDEPIAGEFEISRLAGLYHSRCSGGISDDTPSHAKPVHMDVLLAAAREGITGQGKAQFWERVDRSDFHVSAEDIPDGEYQIHVCESVVGALLINGGEGAVQFRSPDAAGKELLNFDPRNCLIEIHDGAGAVLSSGDEVLAESDHGNHSGGNGMGMEKVSVALDNTGVLQGASGKASYDEGGMHTEFEVEIEDLPPGSYELHVGGIQRGAIEVKAVGGSTKSKGSLEFSNPQKPGKELLDFDPRGLWIEVYSGTDVILETLFPEG